MKKGVTKKGNLKRTSSKGAGVCTLLIVVIKIFILITLRNSYLFKLFLISPLLLQVALMGDGGLYSPNRPPITAGYGAKGSTYDNV